MELPTYRTHEHGPLTTIRIEPGKVCVKMTYELPSQHTKLHAHTFDHTMLCLRGAALISIDGVDTHVRAGDNYFVEAGKQHSVLALEPDTVLECIHEHADIHPDNTDGAGIPIEWLHRLTVH